jgi:hypothetical protein
MDVKDEVGSMFSAITFLAQACLQCMSVSMLVPSNICASDHYSVGITRNADDMNSVRGASAEVKKPDSGFALNSLDHGNASLNEVTKLSPNKKTYVKWVSRAFLSDGTGDAELKVRNVNTNRLLFSQHFSDEIFDGQYSPDSSKICIEEEVTHISKSQSGDIIGFSLDGIFEVFDIRTRHLIAHFVIYHISSPVKFIHFLPNEAILVIGRHYLLGKDDHQPSAETEQSATVRIFYTKNWTLETLHTTVPSNVDVNDQEYVGFLPLMDALVTAPFGKPVVYNLWSLRNPNDIRLIKTVPTL